MIKAFWLIVGSLLLPFLVFAGCCGGGQCCFGPCCQSAELGIGWRRDYIKWRIPCLYDYCLDATARSKLRFEDVEFYTAQAKLRWVGEAYYIRLSAEYGYSEKGRSKQKFSFTSPLVNGTIKVFTNDPIERRSSEVYDFSGAIGYPFLVLHHRLSVVPLIGFSFHRQQWSVKDEESSSSASFIVHCSNPYSFCTYHDPLSDGSDPNIASALGLCALDDTSRYRFTWYGFYGGIDLSYAIDCCWTLYTELEAHLLDRSHRKRDSNTGVEFLDDYHSKRWAGGFNGRLGTIWDAGNCWFASANVDFKWWLSGEKAMRLKWMSVGINMTLGYVF